MFRFFINQDDQRIRIISGFTLVILILSAGFSVYSVMQSQIEEMATSGLKVALENKVKLIENQIAYSVANTKTLNTRIFLTQSLEKIYVDEFNDEGIAGLIKSVDKILTTHF